ncbi:hypothetical protein KQX54_011799 [Cotesia glomerata]|uniref:Uncharacterized protein n=1 Tax=Cotesia glomerata TaxID=32391 RepID=A0AAV7J3I7_COTGL|nr:hypothetical protein KQX54_011799 [Cotesia glomerata]
MAITTSSCLRIHSDGKSVNVSEISGHYFGCVASPNVPFKSKECVRLNVKPLGSSSWESYVFSLSKKTGEQKEPKSKSVNKLFNKSKSIVNFTTLDTQSNYMINFGCTDNIEEWWIEYYAKSLEFCSKYRYKLDEAIQKYDLTFIPLVDINHDNCVSSKF